MDESRNEIKKSLYKERPIAVFTGMTADGKRGKYTTTLKSKISVDFLIPENEIIGFSNEMPAQLLIRWMVTK
jgi:hypothetical protein